MRKWLNSGLALGGSMVLGAAPALSTAASATDRPTHTADTVSFDWTGLYLGGHAGFGRSHNDYKSQFVAANGNTDPERRGDASGKGGLIGLQAGHNWQAGNIVFGIEGDLSRTNVDADTTLDTDLSYESRNRWLGTATGRVGMAFDNLLFYAKGGVAFTGASMTAIVEGVQLEGKSTNTGWTVGGGFEYGLDPNWSLKVEYAHYRFEDESYSSYFPPGNGTVNYSLSESINTVKFGINYRFNADRMPAVGKY